MASPEEIEKLQRVVRDLHMVDGQHIATEPVTEKTATGSTAWEGDVEVFEEKTDARRKVYAWSYETDEGGRGYVAVLGVPPVNNARDAVRIFIASQAPAK